MGLIDNESILMSIKRLLNVDPEEMHFDTDVGTFINSEFMTLTQLGIGNPGFYIQDADTRWADFSDDKTLIQTVKEYVYLRVRMIFDPPASSIVADAFNSKIAELQWRLNIQAEKSWEDKKEEEPYVVEDESVDFKPISDAITSTNNTRRHPDPFEDRSACQNYEVNGEELQLFGKLF